MQSNVGFLIDMDGVIYRGSEVIPGAIEFIEQLIEQDQPFLFLTNNSRRSRRDVTRHLTRLGFPVSDHHVFTCAMATARYLSHTTPNGTAFVIGEGGLLTALHHNGYAVVDSDPDYVVVGEGRTLNFENIEQAVTMVLNGARLVATNPDPVCPTPNGMRPGCGSIVAMLETATQTKAFSVGKPSPIMMRQARKELGLTTAETIMIGDTMETDVLGAVQMGYKSVLVLSGNASRADLGSYAYQPSMIVDSLAELVDMSMLSRLLGEEPSRTRQRKSHEPLTSSALIEHALA